jgi:hypothetical protein
MAKIQFVVKRKTAKELLVDFFVQNKREVSYSTL